MLNLQTLVSLYPDYLSDHQEHILREYLQYHILESLFNGPFAAKVCFIGGTSLRLIHDNQRFSEDLDFDNLALGYEEFEDMMGAINTSLRTKGFDIEWRCIRKGAYHCHFKFPHLLYSNQLAPLPNAKILIQLDTVDQGYDFDPEKVVIDRFETRALYRVAPVSLLLAHKLYTVFERKRMKGRDFFDILFLLKKTTKPDYGYLEQKKGISSPTALKEYLLQECEHCDFAALHADVAPFLFDPRNESIKYFADIIAQTEF